MFIRSLNLIGFRNYVQAQVLFSPSKTIIIGKNAQGKTNLIELVQLITTGKSTRSHKDSEMINLELSESVIHAEIFTEREGDCKISLLLRPSGRRAIKLNDLMIKNSEINRKFSSISFTVNDLETVSGGPALRRIWIDSICAQTDDSYAENLEEFDTILQQRNSYIKSLIEAGINYKFLNESQKEQLKLWSELFVDASNKLVKSRQKLILDIQGLLSDYYQKISNTDSCLELIYEGTFLDLDDLRTEIARDFARGHTTVGPHRHDLSFLIDSKSARNYASQGEKRTLTLALKLSELELLKNKLGEYPILLLDDVMAELDEERQDFLLNSISENMQVIVTTTHLAKRLERWSQNAKLLEVQSGAVTELSPNLIVIQ
jgi:DNA replication and repair protein RecF